jgi:hypothetical protein
MPAYQLDRPSSLRPRRVAHLALCKTKMLQIKGRGCRAPIDSVKPYQRPGLAAPNEARSADWQASDKNRLLGVISPDRSLLAAESDTT